MLERSNIASLIETILDHMLEGEVDNSITFYYGDHILVLWMLKGKLFATSNVTSPDTAPVQKENIHKILEAILDDMDWSTEKQLIVKYEQTVKKYFSISHPSEFWEWIEVKL